MARGARLTLRSFAARTVLLRNTQKLTARELARRAGVSVSTVRAFELGSGGRMFSMLKIADALGMELVIEEEKEETT